MCAAPGRAVRSVRQHIGHSFSLVREVMGCRGRNRSRVSAGMLSSELFMPGAVSATIHRALVIVSQIKPTLEEYFMHLVEADRAQASAVEVSGK